MADHDAFDPATADAGEALEHAYRTLRSIGNLPQLVDLPAAARGIAADARQVADDIDAWWRTHE